MTKQLQYIVEFTIADGKQDEFKKVFNKIIKAVRKNEPDMNAYQLYFNEGEKKGYLIEWFNDNDAVLAHLNHVGPLLPELLEIAPITMFKAFGNISKEVKEAITPLGAVTYNYLGGFIRAEENIVA